MPDRITNTINVDDGQVYRPTVINMYSGDLSTMDKWWAAWETFMFDTTLRLNGKDGIEEKIPFQLLQPIKKSKYPDITVEEEADSLPLQTMCGAIFDSILVHMMNEVADPDTWQSLKRTMVQELNFATSFFAFSKSNIFSAFSQHSLASLTAICPYGYSSPLRKNRTKAP